VDDALGTAQVRRVLDSARDAVILIDASGRVVLANAQVSRLFGYSPAAVAGELVEHLMPGATTAWSPLPSADDLASLGPRLLPASDRVEGRRRDGTRFSPEVFLSAFDTTDPPLVSVTIRDVTDQQRGAADSARLAAIVRSSSDAIVSQSLDGTITS
jgi:PAS domain S-box-containing protein